MIVCVLEGERRLVSIELSFCPLLLVPDNNYVLQLGNCRGVEKPRVEDLAGVGEVPYLHGGVPPWNRRFFLYAFALKGTILLVDGLTELFLVLSHDVLKPFIDINCGIS